MTIIPNSVSVRSQLQRRTAHLHRSVDINLSRILENGWEAYAAFVLTMARAVLPLEKFFVAQGGPQIVNDWSERNRTPEILADLEDLGGAPEWSAIQAINCNVPYLWGILYVLEGSRLGGRVILSRLNQGHADLPTRFLRHGRGKPLWQSYVSQLESSCAARLRHSWKELKPHFGSSCKTEKKRRQA